MLSATAIKPPRRDEFLLAEEAPVRAAEFARLGFQEQAIWGAADLPR